MIHGAQKSLNWFYLAILKSHTLVLLLHGYHNSNLHPDISIDLANINYVSKIVDSVILIIGN